MLRRLLLPMALALASAAAILAVCLVAASNGWIPTEPAGASGTRARSVGGKTMAETMPGMETSPAASTLVRRYPGTLAAALWAERDLGRMAAVTRATGLARSLEGTGPFTVFAPTDEAFEMMTAPTYVQLLEPGSVPRLLRVLRTHIVPGSYSPDRLRSSRSLKTADGTIISAEASGADLVIQGRSVVTERVQVDNGWVYRVDAVLVPPP